MFNEFLTNFSTVLYKTENPANLDFFNREQELDRISTLLIQMFTKGATELELARAIRHSMVIIDTKKYNLDWKQSEKDCGIEELRNKYISEED